MPIIPDRDETNVDGLSHSSIESRSPSKRAHSPAADDIILCKEVGVRFNHHLLVSGIFYNN